MKRILCLVSLAGFICLCGNSEYVAAREGITAVPAPPPGIDLDQLETALANGRLIQAKAMLVSAVKAQQKDPRLDLLTADYNLASGQNDLALATYQTLLENPDLKARAFEGAGIAAFKLGHDDEAYKFLKTSVEVDKSRGRAWNALGVIADRQLDWRSAEKAYRAARTADPHNSAILNNLGYSYLLQHKFTKAIEAFRSALKQRPDDKLIITNINLALAMNGQYAEAIGSEEDAVLLAQRLNNAGVAAHLRHDDAAAIAFLSRAIDISDVYNLIAANNLNLIKNEKKEQP